LSRYVVIGPNYFNYTSNDKSLLTTSASSTTDIDNSLKHRRDFVCDGGDLSPPVLKVEWNLQFFQAILGLSGADLEFHKGGCPVHLKGAPEVERRRRRGVGSGEEVVPPPPENICISYIKMVSFYAFPVIFIDTVLLAKGDRNEKGGCPDTLDSGHPSGFAPGQVIINNHCLTCHRGVANNVIR